MAEKLVFVASFFCAAVLNSFLAKWLFCRTELLLFFLSPFLNVLFLICVVFHNFPQLFA